MKKKQIFVMAMALTSGLVYAQDQLKYESVRYFSVFDNKYFTVRAAHIGWAENYQTISRRGTSGARALTYMRVNIQGDTEWSDWDIAENVPTPGADSTTLHKTYTMLLETWKSHPNTGTTMVGNDLDILKVFAVPNKRASPFWFDNDGDLHTFWKMYVIAP